MKFNLNHEYMSESYDQVRKYGSKWLLVERIAGIVFIVIGIGFYNYDNGLLDTPVVLIIVGIFELLGNNIRKYFWLRRHAKSKLMNAEVELKISETGIESIGPYSSGHFEWNGIEKVVRTPKGILLWPQKGMYWYFPR